jgi:endonuclease-3
MPLSEKTRMAKVLSCLEKSIPLPKVALTHKSPFELLIATILSAQCTDARVNQVTSVLFKTYSAPSDFLKIFCKRLEEIIHSTGFYRSKAKSILGAAKKLEERFGGQVPKTMEELITLPGVGRKTANVVLGHAFGIPGMVVDTHVRRVANRLQFTRSQNPDQIEKDLCALMPQSKWTDASSRLLLHGRHVCRARTPLCIGCTLFNFCPAEKEKGMSERRLQGLQSAMKYV